MTVEPGIIGGMPLGGLDFGSSVNPEAVVSMPDQFDFYDGGGLDVTCLGFAQVTAEGNVNSSKFGPRVAGCGGFIDISQNAKRVLFMGTFTTGGIKVSVEGGRVRILEEGRVRKFVNTCDQITFCSQFAGPQGQEVFYITERCVFKLIDGRLDLIEVAPGIDVERDILKQMEFRPVIGSIVPMDPRLFQDPAMVIRKEFLLKELKTRVRYSTDRNLLRLNFNGLEIDSTEDIDNIKKIVEDICTAAGKKVNAVVNYNAFKVNDQLLDEYLAMGQYIIEKYYRKVARHTTNKEAVARFSAEFQERGLATNIFSTEDEAQKFVLEWEG
jgi:propionate CoA-transferase